jgi:hypothetical protein
MALYVIYVSQLLRWKGEGDKYVRREKSEGLKINPTKSLILRGPHSAGGVNTPPLAKGILPLGTPASGSPQLAAGNRF